MLNHYVSILHFDYRDGREISKRVFKYHKKEVI